MTESRADLLRALLRERFGPDAELRRGDQPMTETLDLAALRALEQAASPAPWEAQVYSLQMGGHHHWTIFGGEHPRQIMSAIGAGANVELIAAMRNAVPALLNDLEAARARLAKVDSAITWGTSCLSCSATLTGAYEETMRAERAERERNAARQDADKLRAERDEAWAWLPYEMRCSLTAKWAEQRNATTTAVSPVWQECDWRAVCATCGQPIRYTQGGGGRWEHEHDPVPAAVPQPDEPKLKRRCAYEPNCDGTPLPADLACDRHPACAECGGRIMHDIGCQTARAERLDAHAAPQPVPGPQVEGQADEGTEPDEHVLYVGPLRWRVCAACNEPWPCSSAAVAGTGPQDMATGCVHCGRTTDGRGGNTLWAKVGDANLCHPDDKARPDCYHLVTVYGHRLHDCAKCTPVPDEGPCVCAPNQWCHRDDCRNADGPAEAAPGTAGGDA